MLGDSPIINSIDLDIVLSEIPLELMKENIKYQISNPLSVNVDYSTIILDKCNLILKEYKDIDEITDYVEESLQDFYLFIINLIDEKFNVGVDRSLLNGYRIVEVGTCMYTFFILRYKKNISTFFYEYIQNHKKEIVEAFSNIKRKDVVTLVLKKKTKHRDDVKILSNLPTIINDIIHTEHDPIEFIELCSEGVYEAEMIKEMLETFSLTGNFTVLYLFTMVDQYNELINELYNDIKTKFITDIV